MVRNYKKTKNQHAWSSKAVKSCLDCNIDLPSSSAVGLITPEVIRPYPRVDRSAQKSKTGKLPGKSGIYTDTLEKLRLEEAKVGCHDGLASCLKIHSGGLTTSQHEGFNLPLNYNIEFRITKFLFVKIFEYPQNKKDSSSFQIAELNALTRLMMSTT